MISVNNLCKNFGSHVVLDNISFEIGEGEIVGFLGNNGVGKSTTMNIITGYIAASSGTVRVGGYDISTQPLEVKRLIGYTPENPPIYNELSVEEYLRFACELKHVGKSDIPAQIETAIETLKLSAMRKRLIGNLSRGYKQRVGLAQALCGEPKVLIMDEPTVGLDPTQIIDIRKTIKALGSKHTVVLSSHILHEVADICGHIIMLNKGKIVMDDTLSNLISGSGAQRKIKLTVKCDPAIGKSILEGVPLVKKIQTMPTVKSSTAEFLIDGDSGAEEAIARAMVKADIGLLALTDVEVTLEDLFLRHTRES